MSWTSTIPEILCCVGIVMLPGLLISYLGGLRSITAWAMAPLVTVAVVAVVSITVGKLAIGFGPVAVIVGTLIVALLALGLSALLRWRSLRCPARDPYRYTAAIGIGAVLAAVVGVATSIRGIGAPDAINQGYDTVFHYNAVRYILQSGYASPLHIGNLGQPSSKGTFYPDTWHALAALLVQLTGTSIPVAVSALCIVIAALVWPLGCLLLCRHLFGFVAGRGIAAAIITGLVSCSFAAFPWALMVWGALWPNTLGMALAPAGVAIAMSITRISEGDTFGAGRRWFFGVVGAWAIAIAHPNSAVSVALICLVPLLVALSRYLRHEYRSGHRVRGTVVLLVLVVVIVVGWWYMSGLPALERVRDFYWPPTETAPQAVGEAFTNGPNHQRGQWLLSIFMVIGAVMCFAWRKRRWLVVAEVLTAVLYVGSIAVGSEFFRQFTGFWYDDSHRIAATLPIVAIPLTVTGLLATGEWVSRLGTRNRIDRAHAKWADPLPITLAIAFVVAGIAGVRSVPNNGDTVAVGYPNSGNHALLDEQKRQFLRSAAKLIPKDALVANNPFQGTAALWLLTSRRVLFPQLDGATNSPQTTYLAKHLIDLSHDSHACTLVRSYDIDYLIISPENFLPENNWQVVRFSGIVDPGKRPGFRLIASDGANKLYKITHCQGEGLPRTTADATGDAGGN